MASKALDGLEAAALRSGKGAKSVSDGMSSLSSSSSKASKDVASTSGAVDSLASVSTSASKNVATTASNLGDLGNISSSASKNLQGATSAISDIAGGSTAATGGIQTTSTTLSGLGTVSSTTSTSLQSAGAALGDIAGSTATASSGLGSMATSATNAASSTQQMGAAAGQVSQETNRASISIKDLAVSLGLVAVASAAFAMLKASLDGAVSRFDTLAGFPVVMERMGFSSEDASNSIKKLSDGIQGLPTTLNGIVASTQRIAILTGDLDTATDTALSLNNAFLASGSSAMDAERGLTQYVQMLSKGSVDIMSWRTLQETMGYALKETAKEFGYTGKSAQNDLYEALKDGEIVFEDFNAKLIELNGRVGGFADMAATGSEGIATSMGNLRNAFVVGVANIITSFDNLSRATTGKSIYKNIDSLKVVVGSSFKVISSVIESASPVVIAFTSTIQATIPVVKTLTPAIVGLIAAYAAYTVITKATAAITAAKIAIAAAEATTKALTIGTKAQIAAQITMTTVDKAGTVATVAQTSAVTLSTYAIGVMTGTIKLSTVAKGIATVATYAWGAAIQFLMGPVGWVVAGIGLLVTGVIALVKWFNKSTEEGERLSGVTKNLSDSTNSLNESIGETSKAYEKNQNDIAATAQANTDLIAKIEKLMEVEDKTAAQKKELLSYVDLLNGSVEGLSLAYSKEADSLNMSSEQLAAKIKLMQEQDGLTASQERFLAISKEQADVDLKLKETNAMREEWNQKLADGSVKSKEHKEAIAGLDEQEKMLTETTAGLAKQQKETEAQVTASIEAVAEATKNSVDDQILSYGRLEDYQRDIVDSLQSKWHEYKDSATDMFDTLSEKSEVTAKSMTKNLKENQRVMTNWSENIAALAERGIDDGLLNTIREAGPEAAGLVKNLVNSSDEELKELSTSFANGGDVAMGALKNSLGSENAEVFDSVSHLVKATGDSFAKQIQNADFASIGKAVPEGAAKGVEAGTPEVAEASKKMADETEKAFKGAMDINSPSGVFEKAGTDITAGAKLGITNGIPTVVEAVKKLAVDILKPFDNVPSQFEVVGKDLMAGFNKGLIAGEAQVMATARRLAASVEAVMRKELDTHSPSRKTQKIGKDTGSGFVKGLRGAEKDIEKAAKKSAKAAKKGVKSGAKSAEVEAKKAAQAMAAKFKEAFDSASYKFKMEEIDATAYLASLEKVRAQYAKTPEQVRKVNLEINKLQTTAAKEIEKIRKDAAKAEQDAIKDSYEKTKNFIEKRKRDNELSLTSELSAWERVQERYKEGSKERIDAEKNVARVTAEIRKSEFDDSKKLIDDKKYYNDLSLTEELAAWEKMQDKYIEGTKEREEAERNVYRVKKEINDKLVSMTEDYTKKISDIDSKLAADISKTNEDVASKSSSINEKLSSDITKINEDLASKIESIQSKLSADITKIHEDLASKSKSINDKLATDILKANEDLASKSKSIKEKSLADEQKLNDEYAKTFDDKRKSYANVVGLFDKPDSDPKQSGEELLGNLKSQLDGLKDWEKEVSNLSNKAIDEGLLEELRAMGPKALPQLKALNQMTGAQLTEYSSIYKEKSSKARQLAEDELKGMKDDTQRRLEAVRQASNQELDELKKDTHKRISDMRIDADAELFQMQRDANRRISEMRTAANAELSQMQADAHRRISDMRRAADAELAQLQADAEKRISEMRETANKELDVLNDEWLKKIEAINKVTDDKLKDLKQIGKNAAQGLLDGLSSMESSLIDKASSIAESVKKAMADSLDIHSPSRWMRDYLVGNMTLGFIKGVDKDESKIVNAASKFADFMKPNLSDITIPNVNIRPFNPSFGGAGGGSSSTDNRKSVTNNIENHFTPAESTPSESARKQKQQLQRLALDF